MKKLCSLRAGGYPKGGASDGLRLCHVTFFLFLIKDFLWLWKTIFFTRTGFFSVQAEETSNGKIVSKILCDAVVVMITDLRYLTPQVLLSTQD